MKAQSKGTQPKTIEMSMILKKTKIQNILVFEQFKYIFEVALKLLSNPETLLHKS